MSEVPLHTLTQETDPIPVGGVRSVRGAGEATSTGIPREQKVLKGHLPRVGEGMRVLLEAKLALNAAAAEDGASSLLYYS